MSIIGIKTETRDAQIYLCYVSKIEKQVNSVFIDTVISIICANHPTRRHKNKSIYILKFLDLESAMFAELWNHKINKPPIGFEQIYQYQLNEIIC